MYKVKINAVRTNSLASGATYLSFGTSPGGGSTSEVLRLAEYGGAGFQTSAIGNGALVINQPNSSGNIISASQSGTTVFNIDNSGNTRIVASLCVKATFSTACAGNTAGTIYASNTTVQSADLAENYISSQSLEPGDVIMPANDGDNQAVVKTTAAYQSQAIGVVSTNPGVTLNSDAQTDSTHPNKYPIALQGRVPVKVSSMNGVIHAGDLLTTSSMPGVAMKATQAGQIIGKALEDYTNTDLMAVGKIMVFVNISWADPNVTITASGNLAVSGQPLDTTPFVLPTTLPQPNPSITLTTPTTTLPSSDQYQQLTASVTSLQQQYASLSAQMVTPQTITDLTNRVASLEKLFPTITSLPLTPLSSQDATISGTLAVSGRTVLSDVGITGKLNMGLLSINGLDTDQNGSSSATINTLSGRLKLQPLALAGIDMFNGKVTIDTSGNLQTQGTITAKKYSVDTSDSASASVGEATIPAGQTSAVVKTTAVTEKSNIFVTVKGGQPIPVSVISQSAGTSFTVEVVLPQSQDVKFSWWIVN